VWTSFRSKAVGPFDVVSLAWRATDGSVFSFRAAARTAHRGNAIGPLVAVGALTFGIIPVVVGSVEEDLVVRSDLEVGPVAVGVIDVRRSRVATTAGPPERVPLG
jgi:hypothetical protein